MINKDLIKKILWTNPNTSVTAEFTNQTINLSDNWETIFIVCRWKYGDNNEITIPVFKGNTKNFQLSGSEFSYDNTYGSGVRVLTRYCYYSLDNDKIISIGNCYGEDVFGSAAKSIANLQAHLVPLKIYKIS